MAGAGAGSAAARAKGMTKVTGWSLGGFVGRFLREEEEEEDALLDEDEDFGAPSPLSSFAHCRD